MVTGRVPDAVRCPPRPAAEIRRAGISGPRVHPVRHGVVPLPDAAARRTAGQRVVLPCEPVEDTRMTERSIAFLGGGRMGEALVSGLLRSGGRATEEILVTCRPEERARRVAP